MTLKSLSRHPDAPTSSLQHIVLYLLGRLDHVKDLKGGFIEECPNDYSCFTAYSRSPAIHDDTRKVYIFE